MSRRSRSRSRFSALPALLVLGSLALNSAPASAATTTQVNRCSDASRELKGASLSYANKLIDHTNVASANTHLNQVAERYQRARAMLDAEGSWNANDPALSECGRLLESTKAYIVATGKRVTEAEARAKVDGPILEAAKGAEPRKALLGLAAVTVDADINAFQGLVAATARARVDSLAPVESACRAAGKPTGATPPEMPPGGNTVNIGGVVVRSSVEQSTDWWCWAAAQRKVVSVAALPNVTAIADGYGNHEVIFDQVFERGDRWDGTAPTWLFDIASDPRPFTTKILAAQAEWYRAFDAPPPTVLGGALAKDIERVRTAVVAAAARNPMSPLPYDQPTMESAAKKEALTLYPNVSVVTTWMTTPDWEVELDFRQIPVKRYRSAQVVFRVGSDDWCRQRSYGWTEQYMNGAFQPSGPDLLEGAMVVGCSG